MASKALGNNPLFKKSEPVEEKLFTDEEVAQIKQLEKPVIVDKVEEFVTLSFKIREEYLKTLRDYAYTKRITVKDALDEMLAESLSKIDKSELLESPEKPKVTRKRG